MSFFKGFKKVDYIVFFLLSFVLFTMNVFGPMTAGLIISVIVTSLVTSLVLGTITNIIRKLFRVARQ
ncbi:hypothetical protein [Fictibacillus sp. NRS-1165]|uniref:hypothetical protein n=1 Tax=Fictibacillus sp. NRS-1165 TaxID=3144463 RepID=UPI003D24BEDB